MAATNNLLYYLKTTERRAGLTVSSAFPLTPNVEQQVVLDALNKTLRYLNGKHYLTFRLTEYTLTTTAGQVAYNLALAPYSQTYWRANRLARNAVRRAEDDFPLDFLDYTELDYRLPITSTNGEPRYYSVRGEDLILHPPPDGSQVRIRYYGVHIGTDATGVTQKLRLSAETDLPLLNDEWEDVLVCGAAMAVRGQQKVDEKFQALQREFEEWENVLKDMGNQPGEDNGPQIVLGRYVYAGAPYESQYYPFFTEYPGGA